MTGLPHTIAQLIPALGVAFNYLRFPGLKTGYGVTIGGLGGLNYGAGVSFGGGSRIENHQGAIVLGNNVAFGRNVHLVSMDGCELRVGGASNVQDNCRLYGDVWLGRRCVVAPNLFASSGTHEFDIHPELPIQIQEQIAPLATKPIRIGDDCWIGINVVISRGVTVGRGCVVGANSVVTRDIAPYSVIAGSPAKVIRQRLSFEPKSSIEARADADLPYFYSGFEYCPSPRDALDAMDKNFVIALEKRDAVGVRLKLSGVGQLRFGDQVAPLASEPASVEFKLPNPTDSMLTFQIDEPCRLYGAQLF